MIILQRLVCQSIGPATDGSTETDVYGMDDLETIAQVLFCGMPAPVLRVGGTCFFTGFRAGAVSFYIQSREGFRWRIVLLSYPAFLAGRSFCRFPCQAAFVFVVKG